MSLSELPWTRGASSAFVRTDGAFICEGEEGDPPQVACGQRCRKPYYTKPVGTCAGSCNIKGPNGVHDGPHTCSVGDCGYSWS